MTNPEYKRVYILDDIIIEARGDNDIFLEKLDGLIGPLAVQGKGYSVPAPSVKFEIEMRSTTNPADLTSNNLTLLQTAGIQGGLDIEICRAPDRKHIRYYILPGQSNLRIDTATQKIDLLANPDNLSHAALGCFVPMLMEMLQKVSKSLLHCAAFILNGKPILIMAPSGYGKSTAALAICYSSGCSAMMIADDACIIRPAASDNCSPDMWPLPRDFKVSENTCRLIPNLAKLPWNPSDCDDERRIAYRNLNTAEPHKNFKPAAVLILQERNKSTHRLEKCVPTDALPQFLRLNLRQNLPQETQSTANTFKALAQLANNCICFNLSVGPDLSTLAEAIKSVLV